MGAGAGDGDGSVPRKGRWVCASRFVASEKLSVLCERGIRIKGLVVAVGADVERGFEIDASLPERCHCWLVESEEYALRRLKIAMPRDSLQEQSSET